MMAPQMPPGLADLLGGGGAPPQQGGGDESSALQILKQMIQLGKQYVDVEPDPEDKATMGKILQLLLQYEAKDQKEKDAALGTSPALKHVRNVYGG